MLGISLGLFWSPVVQDLACGIRKKNESSPSISEQLQGKGKGGMLLILHFLLHEQNGTN